MFGGEHFKKVELQQKTMATLNNKTTTRIPDHSNQYGMGTIRGLVASDTNGLGESDMYASYPKLAPTALNPSKLLHLAPDTIASNTREYRVGDVHNPMSHQYKLPRYDENYIQQQQPEPVLKHQQQRYQNVAKSIGLARPDAWGEASMDHLWSRRHPPVLPPMMCSNSHLPLATTSSPPATQQQQHGLIHPQQPIVSSPPPPVAYDPSSSCVSSMKGTLATSTQEIQAPLPQRPTTSYSPVITPRKDVGVIARPTWSQVTSGVKVASNNATASRRSSSGRPVATSASHHVKPMPAVSRRFNRTCLVKDSSATTQVSKQGDKTTNGSERGSQVSSKANNTIKLLSESMSYCGITPSLYITSNRYPVIRLSNIPWTISIKEIESIFKNIRLPDPEEHAQSIHIIIDKTTGKTQSDAFMEVATPKDAANAVRLHRNLPVKGRKLFVEHSSYEEMMQKLFPDWPGTFEHGKAVYDGSDRLSTTRHGTSSSQSPPLLLPRREIENLLGVCKNFKVHFSRKCGERPFENFISILVRFPWDQPNLITTMQRDHLYEYYKLATSVLRSHMEKPYVNLDRDLIFRMIRAALQCPGFTVPQKKGILAAANMPCPPDLLPYLETPPTPTPSEEA